MKRVIFFTTLLLVGAGCVSNQSRQAPASGAQEPAWKLASAKIGECDAKIESDAAAPDEKTIQDLGLKVFLDEGYSVAKICKDMASGRIVAILAKQELTSPAVGIEPTCVDSCDSVVFATIDTRSGSLNYKKSAKKLGIYSEAYNQFCLVDKAIPASEQSNDKILLYCGSGESGGLSTWYQYEFSTDTLTTVQRMTSIDPEKFDVKSAPLLAWFRYKSNAEIR